MKQSEELLEEFLNSISHNLHSHRDLLEVKDTVDELRSHLLASASAHEAFGLSPSESMAAAIQGFGDYDHLLRELRKEAERSVDKSPTLVCARLAFGLFWGYVSFAVTTIIFIVIVSTYAGQKRSIWESLDVYKYGALIGLTVAIINLYLDWNPLQRLYRWSFIALAGFSAYWYHDYPQFFVPNPVANIVRFSSITLFGASMGLATGLFDSTARTLLSKFKIIPPRIEKI